MRPDADPTKTAYPTPAEIEHHIVSARRIRAEAIAAAFAGLGRIGRAALRQPADGPDIAAEAATAARPPLAAIRSSAEILRDNPDMPLTQRARFIDIVLAEEARLERLITSLGGAHLWSR